MAGIIVADTIQSGGDFIRLNSASQTVATINVRGIYANTGNLLIAANGTIGVASITNTAITGTMTQAQIGTGVTSTGPAFSAYPSGNQTVSNNVWTKMTFDTEEFDTNSNFASSRFTPTVAGYYNINARVVANGYTTNQTIFSIYKNGSEFKRLSQLPNSTASSVCPFGSALIYMNGTTDYVEIYLRQESGSNQTFLGTYSAEGYFQGNLVRAA